MTSLSPAQKAAITRRANKAAKIAIPARRRRTLIDRPGLLCAPRAEMTAGQKAAITRKAHIAARARIEATKTGVAEPLQIDQPVFDVYLDHPRVGCGWRRYIVIDSNFRWVTLFCPATLISIKLDRVTFDASARPAKKCNPHILSRLINEKMAAAERINDRARAYILAEGGSDASKALAILAQ